MRSFRFHRAAPVMMMPRAGDSGSIHGWRIPNKPPQVTANPVFTALRRMGRRVNGGLLPDCRRPWKSSVKRKREFFRRAHESARCDDRDSFLRMSASRRVVPASDAGPDIHLLPRAAEAVADD
jgi:hypothetical protein